MTPRIAVVDDEERMGQIVGMVLRREGYDVDVFQDPREFVAQLDGDRFDLVITDLKMPHVTGIEVLKEVRTAWPEVPVVLLTAHGTVQTAIGALREGAFDYVEKPFDNDAMKALVRRALEVTRLARENQYLRGELRSKYSLDDIIVESAAMHDVFALAKRAARSNATVLVTGDSGTGKELVARSIHYHSDRVGQPFIAVNCKAFSPTLLESELFGHVKGAFTGAAATKRGVFERADGGTVFLDEIGEVDGDFQAKLLRVLQEKEVLPVGAEASRPFDVRVVAATNQNLEAEIAAGRFRDDLYFRLAVIPIRIPPLIERRDDVLPLARHFLLRSGAINGRQMVGWSAEVEAHLVGHDWPGNVRELENVIERAVVLARSETIEIEDLLLTTPSSARPEDGASLQEFLDRATADYVRDMLAKHGGKKAETAAQLGIDRTTLYRLMKKLELE